MQVFRYQDILYHHFYLSSLPIEHLSQVSVVLVFLNEPSGQLDKVGSNDGFVDGCREGWLVGCIEGWRDGCKTNRERDEDEAQRNQRG